MAANIIIGDTTKEIWSRVRNHLRQIREGREGITQDIAVIEQMRDGDGSSAAHYVLYTEEGGLEAGDYADGNAAAKASYDELASLNFILNRGAGQGDGAGVALDQACAKHGV